MAASEDNNVHADNARTRLMHEVAEQMDAIEGDYGDGFEIGRIVTIVEVIKPDGAAELRVRANQRPWETLGMLRVAAVRLESASA